jgi:hypothetical protein
MPLKPKKYAETLRAITNRDPVDLAWELLKVTAEDLDNGVTPDMGKTAFVDFLRIVLADWRVKNVKSEKLLSEVAKTEELPPEFQSEELQKIKEWLKG